MSLHATVETKLLAHGVTPTPQRIEIGMLLFARPQHLSADQILNELQASGIAVSKATVYNTLNLFSRKGIVREVAVDPKHLVYDSTIRAHHHFFNVDSGELVDIDPDAFEIKGLPEPPGGTSIEAVELIVRVSTKRTS